MPKGDDGEEEVPKYKNSVSQNLEAAKQIQHKIDLSFRKISKTSFDKYAQELQQKNTYFTNTKIPEVNSKDLANDKLNSIKKFSGAITKEDDDYYCPKCTSKTNPCPHRMQRAQVKDKHEYPITSSSVYGWFKPYDDLGDDHNLNSVTKSFYDQTHL